MKLYFRRYSTVNQIIATLHQQCVDSELPMPLLSCLEGYAQVLESYGITLFGKRAAHVKSVQGSQSTLTVAGKKRLITQSEYPPTDHWHSAAH